MDCLMIERILLMIMWTSVSRIDTYNGQNGKSNNSINWIGNNWNYNDTHEI